MPQKLDRRVRRTRRQLSEALLALIVSRDYDSLTIQDITDTADLNRATFYLHYGSKEELLVAALEARFDELVAGFAAQPQTEPPWRDDTPEQLVFAHVAEYAPLYKVLLSERGMGYVVQRIIGYIAAHVRQEIEASPWRQAAPAVPPEIIAQHAAGSLFALVSWWVQHDMPYPAAEMAALANRLCFMGALPALDPVE
ncbi:MAG: TetR/AcrR family transcriptional regulator [Anaerolineales bacterium]|nr:TetR/AcrR family transcriptional regulator [Anaerolineales bacterium]